MTASSNKRRKAKEAPLGRGPLCADEITQKIEAP